MFIEASFGLLHTQAFAHAKRNKTLHILVLFPCFLVVYSTKSILLSKIKLKFYSSIEDKIDTLVKRAITHLKY